MAFKTLTAPAVTDSGAAEGLMTDANALTYAALATGGITLGGGVFVAAAVAPAHIVAGSLVTGTLLAGSECKKRTGSYLPFLAKDEDKKAPVASVTAPAVPEPAAAAA